MVETRYLRIQSVIMHIYLYEASQLLDLKWYKEAREVIEELLARHLDRAQPILLLTQLSRNKDKHQECNTVSQACLTIDSETAEAIFLSGLRHCEVPN